MSYPDEHRGHEAFCVQRCAWSQRSATPEGARVLAEHHTSQTLAEKLRRGWSATAVGHETDTRAVTR